ncbi:hypothetical protein MSG28_008562 [Choristoneura fumiferana]|uniref:Uncharacterized protein n=1 Tax=Choristoneura fumiferana TaxID=7141 RepID=A0ACC0J764_CHOFU|nr:hypothetical protein MSG28_008562 [Choristoneura fumiferana]
MADTAKNGAEVENQEVEDVKKLGCWAKFKSLFEDRGFDLEYEYSTPTINILENQPNANGFRRITERKPTEERRKSLDKEETTEVSTSVDNFYEQFANNDNAVDVSDSGKRISKYRHRVSMRPSLYLTNIMEETSSIKEIEGDDEIEEFDVASVNSLKSSPDSEAIRSSHYCRTIAMDKANRLA